ncbi:MAG: YitT family protein [Ruminococcaceae bacterium]|nr:YitT family protein [Oscillospiraceae bacterium]
MNMRYIMKKTKSIFMTILGTMIIGFGIGSFLTPNKIVGGGASGIGTILYHTFGVDVGITLFVFNLVFLILGFKILGKDFVVNTLFGSLLLSVFVEVFSFIPIYTENLMLASIFGGVLFGAGIGLSFAAGASTGGTDILGRIIQAKFSYLPIGKILLFIDGIIILVSLIVFKDIELILYGIITLFLSSYSVDLVISKLNISRIIFVITDKGDEISKKLISTSPRGVTLIDVKGVYSDSNKQMLFCALKESEVEVFQKKVLEIDNTAFIVFAESQKINGKGFYLYK